MRLTIRHDYYGVEAGPGVRLEPSPNTRERLRDRGLLLRTAQNEYVILGDWARLRSAPGRDEPDGEDAWLTFLVYGTDEHFALVSDVDIDANPRAECAYAASPLIAGEERRPSVDSVILRPQPLPILPSTVSEPLGPGEILEVLRGTRRVIWLEWPSNAAVAPTSSASIRYDPSARRAHLDVSALPEGRYSIRKDGRVLRDGLRLAGARLPVAVVELALPVAPVGPGDAPQSAAVRAGARYEVVFTARRTIWKYSIVSRSGSGPLETLSIDSAGNGGAIPDGTTPRFLGPFEESLPNGARAYQFLSAAPIALRRRSPVRLRLTGRRADRMTRNGVLAEYLPVPAKDQLALLTDRDIARLGADERFCSEMFVYV